MDIKHFIFEDDAPPKAKAMPSKQSATSVITPPVPSGTAAAVAANVPAYQKLVEKTSWEDTKEGAILNKYLAPLKDLPIDDRAKLKAAMAQANAQEGLTAAKFLAVFDGLQVALKSESDHFHDTAADMMTSEVTDKQKKISDLAKQVEDLQQQIVLLSQAKNTAEAKITKARNEFVIATTTRADELDKLKQHYAELLK